MSKKSDIENFGENPDISEFRERLREVFAMVDPDLPREQIEELLMIAEVEFYRAAIQVLVPTPEAWAMMKVEEKKVFKIGGKGLCAISTKFGVEGKPMDNHRIHLEFGRQIYGEHSCFSPESVKELRRKIIQQVPTPEAWAAMTLEERNEFKIGRKGLYAISTKFEVEGSPINNHQIHLELGRQIYGEEHKCLQE